MTGQQLKNSILQLAIQGKLVPQDPNDEPASELLKRIRKEKEQLVKDGKLKKKDLESEPITDEEKPFDIPESWEWCRLSMIVSILGDGLHGTPEYQESGSYYFVNGNNLSNGFILIKDETKRCGVSEFQKYKKDINCNTMFVSINGTIGNFAFYNNENIILGKSACYFNLMRGEFKCYMQYLIQSSYFLDYAISNATGSTIKNVSLKTMNDLLIPLPPLSEQQRIVAKIEELMPFVEEYGKSQDALNKLNAELPEQLKKSILQQAIMGKLGTQDPTDEPASVLLSKIRAEKEHLVKAGKLKKKDLETTPIEDDEKPFDIPDSWEWVRIGDIFAHNNGKQLNRGNANGKLMDYITTSNLYWDFFVLDKLKQMPFEENEVERCQALPGDLLVCEGGDIGRACIWNYDFPIMLQNHIHKLRAYYPVETKYFYYIFYLYNKQNLIGGKGIGIQGFSSNALHNTIVPLPPLAEQHRIVEKLEKILPALNGIVPNDKE